MALLDILLTAVLPIVAVAAAGAALGRARDVAVGPLNTVAVYVLTPALVVHSLLTTELSAGTLGAVAVGVTVFVGLMTLVSGGVGRLLGEREPVLGTLVLVATFSNAGNYGIPVADFAFGPVGRATAVVYIVVQSVLMYTLGVYVAARGEGSDWRAGVREVFRIPLVYAVGLALGLRALGLVPPPDAALTETLALVGNAAIPVMLLILGLELADADLGVALGRVSPAAGLKLLVAPVVAVGVALAVDLLPGVGFGSVAVTRVFVLECSMPAAVTTLILSGEFADPSGDLPATQYASTAIFVTTVLSVPLLTVLIAVLRSGLVV